MKKKVVKTSDVSTYEETLDRLPEVERQETLDIKEKYWGLVKDETSKLIGESVTDETIIPGGTDIINQAIDRVHRRENALVKPSDFNKKYTPWLSSPHMDNGLLITETCNAAIASASELIETYTSENSKRAFQGDITYWRAWLKANGHDFDKPVKKEHVILFIIQHAERMPREIDAKLVEGGYKAKKGLHKMATIERRIASMSRDLRLRNFPNPCNDADISTLMQTLVKKHGSSKAWHSAITVDVLNDIFDVLRNGDDALIDVRDSALICFGLSSGGRRRSEISSAKFEDLERVGEEFLYTIPKSKTDQAGEGQVVPVKGRAARLLNVWIERADIKDGYLFRSITKGGVVQDKGLSGIDVNRIVKKRVSQAGYDLSDFGAHSLRSGFMTESGKQRKPLGDAMAMSGHRSVATAMKYYQAGNAINNSAANLID